MTTKNPPPKLYLLTNDDPIQTLLDKLERAFDTGAVSLLQVRRKNTLLQFDLISLYQEAELLVSLADRYGVDVVMNDNLELACHFGTGLHLGQRDGSLRSARQILGDDVVIGRTCHGDMALFKEAKKDGATYGAMGTVFTSLTKPKAKTVNPDILKRASALGLPLCVIGGITLDNAPMLQETLAGAKLDYIAITADIMSHAVDEIETKCQAWQRCLQNWY
ncbi:MAG: thiamine phosphate synthase [Moraxella sp.]|nr:thiamine phosphate synthase [Moraxella sp.]